MNTITLLSKLLPQSHSGWQLFIQLVTGTCQPSSLWKPTYRCKFLLRSLLAPSLTLQWLKTLSQLDFLPVLLPMQATLPCRLHRPYLQASLNRRQVLSILNGHYQQLQQFPDTLFQQIIQPGGALLAQLYGKDHTYYSIKLAIQGELDKEGELSLVFISPQNIVLARLTFTLCQYLGKATLFIGGLQGAHHGVDHQHIQNATKACHGLFPKRLLLEAAILLAECCQRQQILAVSQQGHIYNNWRYTYKQKGQIYADYNQFWQSQGASISADGGYYQLPLLIARKPIECIISKKRAEYRRRYQLQDHLAQQIRELFTTNQPPAH